MSEYKFKKGDKVKEIRADMFSKGSILEVLEDSWTPCCRLVSGKGKKAKHWPLWQDDRKLALIDDELEKVEPISDQFPWQVGDKAWITSVGNFYVTGITITQIDDNQIHYKADKGRIGNSDTPFSYPDSVYARSMQPRGKVTKARVKAWLEEQNKLEDLGPIEAGDWIEMLEDYGSEWSRYSVVKGDQLQVTELEQGFLYGDNFAGMSQHRCKKIPTPEPKDTWEGVKWARGDITGQVYREVNLGHKFSENACMQPISEDDLSREDLLAYVKRYYS